MIELDIQSARHVSGGISTGLILISSIGLAISGGAWGIYNLQYRYEIGDMFSDDIEGTIQFASFILAPALLLFGALYLSNQLPVPTSRLLP